MKISIITVCYNSEKYIEETINSVINQTYKNIEYIIVDGMSTDSTPQIINKYKDEISVFLRGKDKNMYDAINKGMQVATGDYIEILNSDDKLYNEYVIENVVKYLEKYGDSYGVYYGNDYLYYQDKALCKYRHRIQTCYEELLCSKQLTFTGHGAVFISRKVYERIGKYDCDSFKAAGDFDYILRAVKCFKCKHINQVIQLFRVHPNSITSSGAIAKEIDTVLVKNCYFSINPILRLCLYYEGWFRFILTNLFPLCMFYCHDIRLKLKKLTCLF